MADWTTLDTNTLLPGEPVTSAIMLALEENPRAIAEGATGAPKIADKTVFASGSTVTFSSLDDYSGIWLFGTTEITTNASGTYTGATMAYSTNDGSSFSAGVQIDAISGAPTSESGVMHFVIFIDFATGAYKVTGLYSLGSGSGSVLNSGTLSGASLDITDIRLAGGTFSVIANPQGGESAS